MMKRLDPVESTRIVGIHQEPWVILANEDSLANWSHEDEIIYNQINRQAQKLAFYVQAFDFLTENGIRGDYHEYGCHRGRTFRMALTEARRHNLDGMKFIAFDSFEGLPTVETGPSIPGWTRGALHTSEESFWQLIREHGIYTDHCQTIKGFYQDTLTRTLRAQFSERENPIALVCIDCDLYESAIPVFNFIGPLLQEGSLVYIDDFFTGYRGSPLKGVARAFVEFEKQSRFKFVPHLQIGWWGRSFIAYLEGENPPGQ
jgi:Macrocin-O-methyltransferase (TylF)